MRTLGLGFLSVALLATAAYGAQFTEPLNDKGLEARPQPSILPGYLHNEINMAGYYTNTLIKFDPDMYEHHTWYNEDGTAVYANADMMPGGNISLSVSEGKWKFDDGYRPRTIPVDANGKPGVALEMNNYFPGQAWRMLVADGPAKGTRELYTIVPGHQ